MADWLDTLATELGEKPLSQAEITALLPAARDIAHRVERKATPLSTYLLGVAVGRGDADRRENALVAALDTLRPLLPDAPPEDA